MRLFLATILFLAGSIAAAQSTLTVEKIMQDPKWIGTSPSSPWWSADGRYLFFSWNPEKATSDSVYYISLTDRVPKKASYQFYSSIPNAASITWNRNRTAYTYTKEGDVYVFDTRAGNRRITETVDIESSPVFILNDTRVAFIRNQNVYSFDLRSGTITQLSNLQRGSAPRTAAAGQQEEWLQRDQLRTSDILKERKEKREAAEAVRKERNPEWKPVYVDDRNIQSLQVSPSGRYISYRLSRPAAGARSTAVPDYITESGFTTNLTARPKVGAPEATSEFFIYDREKDTVIRFNTADLPGIKDEPDYVRDYPADTTRKRNQVRQVTVYGPFWSPSGKHAIADIRSADNKDRWIVLLDPATGKFKSLDRLRDEAWIGGPGLNSLFFNDPWIDEDRFWYQSEATGYSHLYSFHIPTGQRTQLTSGRFEILSARLSNNKRSFYFTSNEVDPSEQHFYRMSVSGGNREKLTDMKGGNLATISPDEKQIAILHSYSNRPWELFLKENRAAARTAQVTNLAMSAEFKAYNWRDPQLVKFRARDGAEVPARLYKPANPHPSRPAVIFVHGAGYLQNVHSWWSSYFREYMFHNLLTDLGYTVLDIDFRASAGYGRDWRTGIYRHMGGKDLTDQVDGARYLVEQHGVDANRIGIYGGSYGGFITLMALFTEPDVFAAGAALRSVTDWAHYNDPYTSNILNEPFTDSIAYRRSSPIYYAEGLKKPLLMCHGMIDTNVHFQDIVRLTQRLIELKKENWELAVYPLEDHGFVEPTSWMDEYKRILKLFEDHLRR